MIKLRPVTAAFAFWVSYKTWYMVWYTRKQRYVATLVADAYGQGGQWLDPVPR